MAQDNTLGAPTEGLGQNVTFVADGRTGVPQASAMQRGSFKVGARGGEAQRTNQAVLGPAPKGNPLLDTLLRLGGEVIKPHVEAERNRKYLEGMQQAAQGQAINEIVDEQPWYSKVFGSTSLVDGARAYTASAAANAVAAEQEADMVNLRKLSANEMAMHSARLMQKTANTGDTHTDNMIMQSMGQTLPLLMKAQAKEHLRYQGELLAQSIDNNATTLFARAAQADAKARSADSIVDLNDLTELEVAVTEAFRVTPGMQPEAHDKIIAGAAVKSLATGSFAAYRVLQESGKLAAMHPEAAYSVTRAYEYASRQARLTLPTEFALKLSEFSRMSGDGGNKPQDVIDAAKDFNTQYTELTGDPAPLFRVDEVAREITQLYATYDREAADVARAKAARLGPAAKDSALLEDVQMAASVINGNGNLAGVKPDVQRLAWQELARTTPPEVVAAHRLVQAGQVGKDKVYADQLEGDAIAALQPALKDGDKEGRTVGAARLAELFNKDYLTLVKAAGDGGHAGAQMYTGSMGRVFKALYDYSGGQPLSGVSAQIAYVKATSVYREQKNDKHDVDALAGQLKQGTATKLWHSLGGDTFAWRNHKALANLLVPASRGDLTSDDAADVALERAKRTGQVAALAGWAWGVGPTQGNFEKSFVDDTKIVAPSHKNRAFDFAVNTQAALSCIKRVDLIGQLPDLPDRTPRIFILGADANNRSIETVLSAKAARDLWANRSPMHRMEAIGEANKAKLQRIN